ncbi:hypothetical protein ACLOJK_017464 [Asimina triloba]
MSNLQRKMPNAHLAVSDGLNAGHENGRGLMLPPLLHLLDLIGLVSRFLNDSHTLLGAMGEALDVLLLPATGSTGCVAGNRCCRLDFRGPPGSTGWVLLENGASRLREDGGRLPARL